MQFKKPIVNVGGKSLGIRFSESEIKIYNIKKEDILDLSLVTVIKNKNS